MNVERVENMFDGVQEAFISEMRNLKNELVKEFDASEKLKELNQKSEVERRQLTEENEKYKIKEKKLENDLTIARSTIEEKDKLIKVLDPTGVGQRLIHNFHAEEIDKMKKRINDLESREKDLLENNTKLESRNKTQEEKIAKLETEKAHSQNQQKEYSQKIVPNLEAEVSLLKEEHKKLKDTQSKTKNKLNDSNNNRSKRKTSSARECQKRTKISER